MPFTSGFVCAVDAPVRGRLEYTATVPPPPPPSLVLLPPPPHAVIAPAIAIAVQTATTFVTTPSSSRTPHTPALLGPDARRISLARHQWVDLSENGQPVDDERERLRQP